MTGMESGSILGMSRSWCRGERLLGGGMSERRVAVMRYAIERLTEAADRAREMGCDRQAERLLGRASRLWVRVEAVRS